MYIVDRIKVKPSVLFESTELGQQLLSLRFQGGNDRLENLVCFLESQNVGRIEDLIGDVVFLVLSIVANRYTAGGPTLGGSTGCDSILVDDFAFLGKVVLFVFFSVYGLS